METIQKRIKVSKITSMYVLALEYANKAEDLFREALEEEFGDMAERIMNDGIETYRGGQEMIKRFILGSIESNLGKLDITETI